MSKQTDYNWYKGTDASKLASRQRKERDNVIIVAGFPGVGKSHFCKKMNSNPIIKKNFEVLDSDSSSFSWIGKERNPDFPKNYIEHIQSHKDKEGYILVSTHKKVRDALVDAGLSFFCLSRDGIQKGIPGTFSKARE